MMKGGCKVSGTRARGPGQVFAGVGKRAEGEGGRANVKWAYPCLNRSSTCACRVQVDKVNLC